MGIHLEAISCLKKRLDELVELAENLEKRITLLSSQKEEASTLASEICESIKVLGEKETNENNTIIS